MFQDKIFLASQSPRRKELIRLLFRSTDILPVSFDEPKWSGEPPLDYLENCVSQKWRQALPSWRENFSGLIVADTIVSCEGKILGKPEHRPQAVAMLSQLSGRWHTVFTAFKIGLRKSSGERESEVTVVETAVKFRALSAGEIKSYVATGEPMDKAGAYGLQERGLGLIQSVRGPYSNVIGLPIERVRKAAERVGFR